jgi:hypothetical protein
VQERGRGLSIRADLAGGRAQSVGSLQRVSALAALAALLAVADVDAKLANQRLARNLGLELIGDAGFDKVALTVRAGIGEVGLMALGDLFGGRWRTVAMSAVFITRFATGRFRIHLGRTFAERSRLSLAGAKSLLESAGQLSDLGLEFSNLLEEFPTTGTRGFVHDSIVVARGSISCASFADKVGLSERALNKYPIRP